MKKAHIGVAMGLRGTEVAKESADLVGTDDNFASIVAGIAEGRATYRTIRKVVLLSVATGAAESCSSCSRYHSACPCRSSLFSSYGSIW